MSALVLSVDSCVVTCMNVITAATTTGTVTCVNIYTAYIPYNALSRQDMMMCGMRIVKTSKSLCTILQPINLWQITALVVTVNMSIILSTKHYCYIQDDSNVHLQTTHTLLSELNMLLTTEAVKPCLQHVNSLLTNVILKCKTTIGLADKSTSKPQPFSNREKIAPGKKSENQWKFKKVVGSPGRKKSSNRLR